MAGGDSAPGGPALRGRRAECAVLDRLREGARAGRSGVLVVRGEAGVGKTALLDYAIGSASDMRVVRASGVESEMELAFAALHQLCAPLLDRLERLPAPQRHALEITFGLSEGPAPDRLFVGLAVLGLLSEAAEERPLLCVIDDAQWLDRASAQALAFVARRLLAESVVMLFAVREPIRELRRAAGAGGRGAAGFRRPRAPHVGRARAPGSAGRRPARGRSPWEPARPVGAAARARAGRTGRRVRAAGGPAARGAHRGPLPAAPRGAPGGHQAAIARGGGRPDRRSRARLARRGSPRAHRRGA